MAIEMYDQEYSHDADKIDRKTGVKVKGLCDHDKLQHWQSVLEKTLRRRIVRSREKQADQEYFVQSRGSQPSFAFENTRDKDWWGKTLETKSCAISRASLELKDIMQTSDDIAN